MASINGEYPVATRGSTTNFGDTLVDPQPYSSTVFDKGIPIAVKTTPTFLGSTVFNGAKDPDSSAGTYIEGFPMAHETSKITDNPTNHYVVTGSDDNNPTEKVTYVRTWSTVIIDA